MAQLPSSTLPNYTPETNSTWSVGVITSVLPVNLIFRAVTFFKRMYFSIVFKWNGNLKGKNSWLFIWSCVQAFPTIQWKGHNKVTVPLLSPLNFFSSRLSCASYSLSNSICSIWASIRSLEVSTFSPEMNGPSATLFKTRWYRLTDVLCKQLLITRVESIFALLTHTEEGWDCTKPLTVSWSLSRPQTHGDSPRAPARWERWESQPPKGYGKSILRPRRLFICGLIIAERKLNLSSSTVSTTGTKPIESVLCLR